MIARQVSDMGFVRFQVGDSVYSVADESNMVFSEDAHMSVVVDRLIKKDDEAFGVRLTDSLRIAMEKGQGYASLYFFGIDGQS